MFVLYGNKLPPLAHPCYTLTQYLHILKFVLLRVILLKEFNIISLRNKSCSKTYCLIGGAVVIDADPLYIIRVSLPMFQFLLITYWGIAIIPRLVERHVQLPFDGREAPVREVLRAQLCSISPHVTLHWCKRHIDWRIATSWHNLHDFISSIRTPQVNQINKQ